MSCRPGVISIKTPSLLYSSDNVEKEKAWKVIHQFVFLRFSVVCFLCYNIIHSHLGEVKHSENLLESDNSRRRDIAIKRGQFIGKVNSLSLSNLVFSCKFWIPSLQASMEVDCERLYAAWNVAVRHAWGVPNTTHRYLIEEISGFLHPKVMLASRYIGFFKSLCTSLSTAWGSWPASLGLTWGPWWAGPCRRSHQNVLFPLWHQL